VDSHRVSSVQNYNMMTCRVGRFYTHQSYLYVIQVETYRFSPICCPGISVLPESPRKTTGCGGTSFVRLNLEVEFWTKSRGLNHGKWEFNHEPHGQRHQSRLTHTHKHILTNVMLGDLPRTSGNLNYAISKRHGCISYHLKQIMYCIRLYHLHLNTIYLYIYGSTSVCLSVCLPAWLAGWLSACLSLSLCLCYMYMYMYMYVYVMYMYMYVYVNVNVYVNVYVYVYANVYVYVYVWIYICICMYM
jgi:hypothetical protein